MKFLSFFTIMILCLSFTADYVLSAAMHSKLETWSQQLENAARFHSARSNVPSNPLELLNQEGTEKVFSSTARIEENYTSARVVYDQLIGNDCVTYWIIYNVSNWNYEDNPLAEVRIVPSDGATVTVHEGYVKSAQGFTKKQPGAVVFETSSFSGYGTQIDSSVADTTKILSQDHKGFSVIINGGSWKFYTGLNFTKSPMSIGALNEFTLGNYSFQQKPLSIKLQLMKGKDETMTKTVSLELSGNTGTKCIQNTTACCIPSGYNLAKSIGTDSTQLWIAYSTEDWDSNNADNSSAVTFIPADGTIWTVTAGIRSVRRLAKLNPGIILFKNSSYRGDSVQLTSSQPAVPDAFLKNVHSCIVTGGVWKIFDGYDFTGTNLSVFGKVELEPGYYDFGSLAIKDRIVSVKYIRPM